MPRAPRRCPGDKGNCTELMRNTRYCVKHTVAWQGPRTASSVATSQRQRKESIVPAVLKRDGCECQIKTESICTGYATTVDKKRPAAQRPDLAYDAGNLRAACDPCNDQKARTVDQCRSSARRRRR